MVYQAVRQAAREYRNTLSNKSAYNLVPRRHSPWRPSYRQPPGHCISAGRKGKTDKQEITRRVELPAEQRYSRQNSAERLPLLLISSLKSTLPFFLFPLSLFSL